MPAYPWALHFLHDEGLGPKEQDEQFKIYKRFNITVSCVALTGIGLIMCRRLGPALGIPLTLATAFTFFVFKAVLVQPELTFFFLYFCEFVLMLRCLQKPSWKAGLALGLLAGVAHLFKASSLPTILLFLILAGLRAIGIWWKSRQGHPEQKGSALGGFAAPVLCLAGFLAVTGTFLRNTVRTYGSPFYDPNTRYYFWAESPGEMGALQVVYLAYRKPQIDQFNYKDPRLLAFLPKWEPDAARRDYLLSTAAAGGVTPLEGEWDILPGARNWFKNHTWKDALDRVWRGFFDKRDGLYFHNLTHRNDYFYYVEVLCCAMVFLLVVTLFYRRKELGAALKKNILPILFAVGCIFGNLLLYAWWAEISNRNRFFLTQFLPLLFSMGLVIRWCCDQLTWETLDIRSGPVRVPAWLGGWSIKGPFLAFFVVLFLWKALIPHIREIRELADMKVAVRNLNQ